jgi:hypothetical protein
MFEFFAIENNSTANWRLCNGDFSQRIGAKRGNFVKYHPCNRCRTQWLYVEFPLKSTIKIDDIRLKASQQTVSKVICIDNGWSC